MLPVDVTMDAVSASHPGADAEAALSACNVGSQVEISKVTGMGRLADGGARLSQYVPLTGREPQVKERGPVWIVTVEAMLPQPGSTEVWINPTCVVTQADAGWFATGPVLDRATGTEVMPGKPPMPPTMSVPPLVP